MKPLADPALPGLSLALDPDALAELLSRELPECAAGARVVSARAVDVQYEPGQRAAILVRMKFQVPGTGRTTKQLLCVRVLKQGESPAPCPDALLQRYHARRKQSREAAREAPLETAWLPLPRHGLLVHAYPLDPGLPALLDVTDPQSVEDALTRLWTPRRVRAKKVAVDTLAYTPESRVALAYEALCEDHGTKVPHSRRLVGKLHVRRSPARLFANAWTVWRSAKGRVNIAPPVGFIESLGLSLQEFVQGQRLSDLAGTGGFLKPVRQAARAIAHVHAQRLPLHSERDLDKEAAVVRRWLAVLDGILPARREEIARLGEKLLAELAARFTPRGAVHADFHLANILVHRGAITIVDWDQAAHGDPMLDVGRLLASLRVSALRTSGSAAGLSEAADAFLSAYLEASGEDEQRARLFEAGALLIAAGAPFRLQREGWREQAEVLLDETWACLDRAAARSMVAMPSHPALPPLASRIEWAQDRTLALALAGPLLRAARQQPGLDLIACVPHLRAHSEDGFEVEYEVSGFASNEARSFADESPFTTRLLGVGAAAHAGRGALRRLEALRAALAADPGAPALPRPVGHAAPLAMNLFELGERSGDAFATLARARDAGRALAALQSARAELDKERPLDAELAAARRRIDEALPAGGDADARLRERALALLSLARDARDAPLVPSPRGVRPSDFAAGHPGLAVVRDVVLAPQPVAAALVHGRLLALDRADASSLAGAFLEAWSQAAACDEATLAPHLALGRLRAACHLLRDAATRARGERLLCSEPA